MGHELPSSAPLSPSSRIRARDDFPQRVKLTLAQRVGLLCSNPGCKADTAGPQSDPSNVVNIGVAAHITAASAAGPRFNVNLSDKERRSAANGIWLCQSCAKLIDSDVLRFPTDLLQQWKAQAEEEARKRLGKTNSRATLRSHKKLVAALKRDQQMRDDLQRLLLKTGPERMALRRGASRVAKFAHSEVVIRRIDDNSYPDIDDGPGISGWFKLELLDFYHGGICGIVDIQYILMDSQTRNWAAMSYEQSNSEFPDRFTKAKIFVAEKIPWRNILHYDMRGDQYYPQPHLYCTFADNGTPYEGEAYFLITEGGYEYEVQAQDKLELEALLRLAVH
jgi:hypothetical protein